MTFLVLQIRMESLLRYFVQRFSMVYSKWGFSMDIYYRDLVWRFSVNIYYGYLVQRFSMEIKLQDLV